MYGFVCMPTKLFALALAMIFCPHLLLESKLWGENQKRRKGQNGIAPGCLTESFVWLPVMGSDRDIACPMHWHTKKACSAGSALWWPCTWHLYWSVVCHRSEADSRGGEAESVGIKERRWSSWRRALPTGMLWVGDSESRKLQQTSSQERVFMYLYI